MKDQCNYKKKNSIASWRIGYFIVVFCFMFLPMRPLLPLMNIAYANSTDSSVQDSPDDYESVAKQANKNYISNLRSSRISAVNDTNKQNSRDKLRSLIEQVRSIELSEPKQTPEPTTESRQEQLPRPGIIFPEPVVTEPETEVEKEQEEQTGEIQIEAQNDLLNSKTIELLGNMSEKPGRVENPFELGEVLFLSGYLKEAAVFYQEALSRIDANNINLAQERAWILFQIGNCLRSIDMPVASKMYGQLISEYPNSPWTELANVQVGLIEWLRRDEPQKLISSNGL